MTTYTLTDRATDPEGNVTSASTTFTVVDTPPPPGGTVFGSSIKAASDVATLQGYGTDPKAFRVFYTGKLPTTWRSSAVLASIPAGSIAVVSYHQPMTQAELAAFIGSPRVSLARRVLRRLRLVKALAPVLLILCYFHEPEDNFTTAAQQAQFRADVADQAAIIHGLGVEHWLILQGYTLTDAGHRNGRDENNFYVPGSHDGVGVDFYSKLNMDNIFPLTAAFAGGNGIPWSQTEGGMSKSDGDDATRAAYMTQLRAAALSNGADLALAWADNKSGSTFDTRWTVATARAWFGVAA